MAEKFERLSYTKDWNNASDFPTYEENETQVRADMQLLHNEVRDFINDKLIPGVENLAVPGTGDMKTDVYDPAGVMQDVFAYARAQASAAVGTAKTNTESAVSEYNTGQEAKFNAVETRLTAAESALRTTPGAITLLREYRAAGTYTVELPAGTVAVYALAVGAGGGGGNGSYDDDSDLMYSCGGGGGAGGSAVFLGPILPENIADLQVVVGAGGAEITAGGSSRVFGITAAGGGAGGGYYANTTLDNTNAGSARTITDNEYIGANGGKGARYSYTSSSGAKSDNASTAGETGKRILPLLMKNFSAGGGGGGSKLGGMDENPASAGAVCGFGKGGNGGAYNADGSDGGQCCGGGGAGGSAGCKGGKGGDGYVAIWVQRSNIS